MLALSLKEQIYSFIKKFRLVEERQVRKFFDDWGGENVSFEIMRLLVSSLIHKIPDGRLSTSRILPMQQRNYEDTIHALNVLCEIPSHRVRWMDLDDYPSEIIFITDEDIVYDITVFDERNWVSKYALIQRTRHKNLPDGESDPVNHIAVVPNEDILHKVEPLGFSTFATIDRNNHVEIFAYDD